MPEVFVYDPTVDQVVLREQREARQRVHIIRDVIDATWHPVDGKHYDSKSAFRNTTKAAGGIEVGNEQQKRKVHRSDVSKADIARAYDQVASGYKPIVRHEHEY